MGPPPVRRRPVGLRGLIFSFISFLVAIPSAIKVFNWTATIYKGSVSLDSPMLYAFGFIGLFTIGGLTGLFLAAMGLDIHVHDTYFVVAHFHYIMVGGAIMGYLGGLHYWWPKITGRLYHEALGQVRRADRVRRVQPDVLPAVPRRLPRDAAALPRVSARVPGVERDVLGRRVDPRRSATSCRWSTSRIRCSRARSAATIRGARKGLEWEIPSPPPTENFAVTPIVTHGTHQHAPSKEVGIV